MSTNHRGIVVEGLVRTFKGDIHAVDGIDLEVARRRDLRLPRAQRRGQVDHRPHAHDAAAAHRGPRDGGRASTSPRQGADVRRHIGAALQEAALDNFLTGPRAHGPPGAASTAWPRPTAPRRGDRAARARRAHRGGRPQGRRLLGRHEAPARPRAGARAPARRSSSSTSRRPGLDPQSRSALWDEVAAPGHATTASPSSSPRSTSRRPTSSPTASGSSTAARSWPRARRTRSSARSAATRSRRSPPTRTTSSAPRRCWRASASRAAHSPKGVAVRLRRRRRAAGRHRARARRRGHRARAPAAALAVARRRLPGQDRALAGGRGRGGRAAAEEPVPA